MSALILKLPLSEGAVLSPVRVTCGCGTMWHTERHCNAGHELHLILSGSCLLDLDTQTYGLQSGAAVLIQPGVFHYPHGVSEGFHWISLSISPEDGSLADRLLRQLAPSPVLGLDEYTMELCRRIYREETEPGLMQTPMLTAQLTQLLISILRMTRPVLPPKQASKAPVADERNGIIDNFFSPWPSPVGSETELAALLHLSRRQLNRVLLQSYGMSFREKLLTSRMDYAAWLLRTTDRKVSEIAIMAGYTAESSFFKAFRTHFHTTPQAYRCACGKKGSSDP